VTETAGAASVKSRARRAVATDAGTYAKGKLRAGDILDAAIKLMIDEGYHNLSMRGVAQHAGIRLGNLQHYFPTKNALLQAMLDRVIDSYIDRFNSVRGAHDDPEREFRAIVSTVIGDLNKRRTTVFFTELWSLSNHERAVTSAMDQMYERYRHILADIIVRLNPALSAQQIRRLALFISASIEGHTVFIGYRKPWIADTAAISEMAIQSFLWLIRHGDVPDHDG
jgi:AcrR family transcriptional regulator